MIHRSVNLFHGSYLIWVSDDDRPPPHLGSVVWISREQCRNWEEFLRTAIARRAQVYGCQVACPETADTSLRVECRTLRKKMFPSNDQKLARIADDLQLFWIADELRSRKNYGASKTRDIIDILDQIPCSQRTDRHKHQRWLLLALNLL